MHFPLERATVYFASRRLLRRLRRVELEAEVQLALGTCASELAVARDKRESHRSEFPFGLRPR